MSTIAQRDAVAQAIREALSADNFYAETDLVSVLYNVLGDRSRIVADELKDYWRRNRPSGPSWWPYNCESCGTTFWARRTARTCSAKCRQRLSRMRSSETATSVTDPNVTLGREPEKGSVTP